MGCIDKGNANILDELANCACIFIIIIIIIIITLIWFCLFYISIFNNFCILYFIWIVQPKMKILSLFTHPQ